MTCPVHNNYDSEGSYNGPPEVEELVVEYVRHLKGECSVATGYCLDCYDEWQIRRLGIEDVNLFEDHELREMLASCTCKDVTA